MSEMIPGTPVDLQLAAVSGNGVAYNLGGRSREAAVYVTWSSGVTAGQVAVETADETTYTGTWALFTVVNATADKQDVVQVGGSTRAVRTRISTPVVGGTVTARLYAN